MNFNKLKSQKGFTGIDVVIAITIISITTIAIISLYVNVIAGSKKTTRNSAATRIATSIMENIDSMYYADVEQELHNIKTLANISKEDENSFSFIANVKKETIFNTKIQSGYNVEINSTEIANTTDKGSNEDSGALWDCPLVLDIKITVSYESSGTKKNVTLRTIKERELLEETNPPNLNDLLGTEYVFEGNTKKINSLNQIQPIKWSTDSESYIRTNRDDNWYNYRNKEWAKVVITTDNSVFDFATGSISEENLNKYPVFVWVPRFGKSNKDHKVAFAYSNTNNRIKSLVIGVNSSVHTIRKFNFFRYKNLH